MSVVRIQVKRGELRVVSLPMGGIYRPSRHPLVSALPKYGVGG